MTGPRDDTAAAFFDVDNTMMQGASIYWFARGLAARNYFTSPGPAPGSPGSHCKFRLLATEHPEDMSNAQEAALAFVEGWPVDDARTAHRGDLRRADGASGSGPARRALAQLHLDAGQRVWLVTAAPVELGRVIAERLGLTGAIGTVAEIRDGVYTGRLVGDLMHGPAKAEAITRLAAVEGLDLARCTAYSDSVNDVPMLSAVGQAVAVNPDPALLREARAARLGGHGTSVPSARPPGSPYRRPGRAGLAVGLAWRRRPPTIHRARPRRDGATGTAPARDPPTASGPRLERPSRSGRVQQFVQGLLDGLPHLVGEVEHHHRISAWSVRCAVSIGAQNSISHLRGNGISPSGPSQGNVGVTGKYGSRAAGPAA